MAGRVYTQEEAEAILARAIELQVHQGATSHEDLIAAAKEVGVPASAIERAASEVLARKRDEADVRELRMRQWRAFYGHLVPYLLVNALLAFINVMTTRFPWAVVVLLAWGIGLGSHLLAVAMPDPRRLRRRIERDRTREERRRGRGRDRSFEAERQRVSEGSRARVDEAAGVAGTRIGGVEEDEAEDESPAQGARRGT
jgi:hypothetical protein